MKRRRDHKGDTTDRTDRKGWEETIRTRVRSPFTPQVSHVKMGPTRQCTWGCTVLETTTIVVFHNLYLYAPVSYS